MTKLTFPAPDIRIIAKKYGLEDIQPLLGDASSRRYYRGRKKDKSIIVMLYPDASNKSRTELRNFLEINKILSSHNVKVAECYEVDKKHACALLEDLGTQSFGDCFRNQDKSPENLYKTAIQPLLQMKKINRPNFLPVYEQTCIYANRRQLIDYYMAFRQRGHPGELCVNEFYAAWDKIEQNLPPCPQGFVHGDYHLENLIHTKEKQCAVIDHQDAFYGPIPYDLVNLLEDARVDVPQDIRASIIRIYTQNMDKQEKESFMMWYRVLAAQFHGRVIGLFIKFSAEQNRDSYLVHIPRLQKYLTESLKDPVLAPLKEWFNKVKLDFQPITPLDGGHIRAALNRS